MELRSLCQGGGQFFDGATRVPATLARSAARQPTPEWGGVLTYKTLVMSGLRVGELASLTVGQLNLTVEVPYAELDAADAKGREDAQIALHPDLAADLSLLARGTAYVPPERSQGRGRANPDRPATGCQVVLHVREAEQGA